VAEITDLGLDARVGYEMEFAVGLPGDAFVPAHHGPAYSPHALLAVDEFIAGVFADFDANGLPINQLHAEYGLAQVELSLIATDPVTAADRQLLARQTLHAAARAHGLRLSFAPLDVPEAAGNGWHLHVSVWRDGRNLLRVGNDPAAGPAGEGAAFLAGVLRELPAVAALTAPSVPSLARLRPGYFAGAYQFWGVENREAALRYVPGTALLGADHANLELKVSDASANPYLALAAVLGAGLAGLRDGAVPPEPVAEDPGGWPAQRRIERNIAALPATPEEREKALLSSALPARVLGEPLLGAFLAARRSDAAWARDRDLAEVVAAHRWRY
jgi:glutamine synthetase